MRYKTYAMAILLASLSSLPVSAAAPVADLTANMGSTNNEPLQKQLDDLARLLETRNKMQVRLQSQLDLLSQEMSMLQGNLELFNHKIEEIENRQRNLYQLIEEQKKAKVQPVTNVDNAKPESKNEQLAYQSAVDLVLVNKEYQQAISAFEAFVVDYPKSEYVANAQYWLGQLLYKQKKRDEARAAFLIVIEDYPKSNKRADALFKIGLIDEYLGNLTSAKSFYQKSVSEYPNSSAAELAKERLKVL